MSHIRNALVKCLRLLPAVVLVTWLFPGPAMGQSNFIEIISPTGDWLGATVTTPLFNIVVNYSYSDAKTSQTGTVTVVLEIHRTSDSHLVVSDSRTVSESGKVTFTVDFSAENPGQSYNALAYIKEAGWGPYLPNVGIGLAIYYDPPVLTMAQPTVAPSPTASAVPSASGTLAPAAVYISSDPHPAQIWIDEVYRTDTTFSGSPVGFTDLTPGVRYEVVIRKEGYQDYREVVTLSPNQIYDINAVLEPGTTPTGRIQVNSDPTGALIYLNDIALTTSPTTLQDVPPGTYDIRLRKDGYEDYRDRIAVTAGTLTEVNAVLPPVSGGLPIGPIAGGAAGVVVAGGLIKLLAGRGKGATVTTAPPAGDLYREWWDKASPAQRKNWDGFEKFLTNRLGPASLQGYQDANGNASWTSAYQSYQKEVKAGTFKGNFENWTASQRAGQEQAREMAQRQDRMQDWRPEELAKADRAYGDAVRNQQLVSKLNQISRAVSGDTRLMEFVNNANDLIVDAKGHVDAAKLGHLQNTLEKWIVRDKLNQVQEYTTADAWEDSFNTWQAISRDPIVRIGAAIVTGGVSEAAFIPVSAVATMGQNLAAGRTTYDSVVAGLKQGGFELALGEGIGRGTSWGLKRATPYITKFREAQKLVKLAKSNPALADDLGKFKQMVDGVDDFSRYNRDLLMKQSEVVKLGKTAPHVLDDVEKAALDLQRKYGKSLAENADQIPQKYKDVLGTARQKVFENSRNGAINDVLDQMKSEGIIVEDNAYLIQQTGTHAQPGNPSFNALKSDFDHTVDFGSPKYNRLYEDRLNESLRRSGVNPSEFEANVYGSGTSNAGSYEGGAFKQVEHYNETSGSQLMVRNVNGQTVVSREIPQNTTSILSRMKQPDIASAAANYQKFATEKITKAGGIDKILRDPTKLNASVKDLAKEVSRKSGQYSVDYADHFLKTGNAGYQPSPAARVADLIKRNNLPVDQAMSQAGYSGDKGSLLKDFMKLLGI